MGCSQSKIDNEEAVLRCKDRKQYMKAAVVARNAFAAAHSAHAIALKNTGLALSDYAPGESHHVHTPPTIASQPPIDTLPPPPPLPNFPNPPPIFRAASMPEFLIPKPEHLRSEDTILEGDEEDADEEEGSGSLERTSKGKSSMKVDLGQTPDQNQSQSSVSRSTWDYFFNVENMPRPSLEYMEEDKKESVDRKSFGEGSKRIILEEDMNASVDRKSFGEGSKRIILKPDLSNVTQAVDSSSSPSTSDTAMGRRLKPSLKSGISVSLRTIFNDLDDHFLKASESAHEVSKMLEANRLHYHSNFADNRGHIDHAARLMRVITWNRSFRYLANQDDLKDDFDFDEHETHATVLDKLLAWEKKLYDEVKAGELMKLEYQKKVILLNKQKRRGMSSEAVERTKAAVSHLHTRYIVDMQSMDSTVTEINRLRDRQLYPKLVALVDGMARMWETMRVHHDHQLKIATSLKYVDISQSPKETSDHHHERTIQLWAVIQEWHTQFDKLITHQKEYIKSLNSWLRLNLIPIESSLKEKVSSPPRPQNPPIQALLLAWQDQLEKLPDEAAKAAIFNFAAVIHTIVQHQEEEIKFKLKCEATRKELNHKTRQFKDWHDRYVQRKDGGGENDGDEDEVVVERRIALEAIEKRLEEEERAYQKECVHVRDKSLVSLKTRLPELFGTMSEYTQTCSEMYRNLKALST